LSHTFIGSQIIVHRALNASGGIGVSQTIGNGLKRVLDTAPVRALEVPLIAPLALVEVSELLTVGDLFETDIILLGHEPSRRGNVHQIIPKELLGLDITGLDIKQVLVLLIAVPIRAHEAIEVLTIELTVGPHGVLITSSFICPDSSFTASRALGISRVPKTVLCWLAI
jgi:hypothetical protein